MIDVDLAYGENNRFVRPVGDITVNVTTGPEIELVASFLADPQIPIPPVQQGTTLAIHMSPEVAAALYAQLRNTFDAMGWPLPIEGASQGGRQQYVTTGPDSTPQHTRVRLSPERFPRSR